jgi:hypothetical protein
MVSLAGVLLPKKLGLSVHAFKLNVPVVGNDNKVENVAVWVAPGAIDKELKDWKTGVLLFN